MSIDEDAVYEVRQGRLRTILLLLACSILPAVVIGVGLWNWPDAYQFLIIGVVFELVPFVVLFDRIRRAYRRERMFVVDAVGVFLGTDDRGAPAVTEQWSQVEMIVHFEAYRPEGDGENVRLVGVVRKGKIAAYRRVEGWTFDPDRAAAAAARFAPGVPVREAPYQSAMPSLGYVTIALPPEWLAMHQP